MVRYAAVTANGCFKSVPKVLMMVDKRATRGGVTEAGDQVRRPALAPIPDPTPFPARDDNIIEV